MYLAKTLNELGIGLSRVLRYSFGGVLLIVFAAVLDPSDTWMILKKIQWQLAVVAVIVLGAGVYSVHRHVVVPIPDRFAQVWNRLLIPVLIGE